MQDIQTQKPEKKLAEGSDGVKSLAADSLLRNVFTLIEHSSFQPDLSWMEKQLGTPMAEINKALDTLVAIEAISREPGKIEQKVETLSFPKYLEGRTLEEAQRDHSVVVEQHLNSLLPNEDAFTRNGTYMTDHETFHKLKLRIKEALDQFRDDSLKLKKKDLLACVTITANNLLNTDKKGGLQ